MIIKAPYPVLVALAAVLVSLLGPGGALAQDFEPTEGQAGKDVVWVPTPAELVEKMLDMAKVTPQDFVMDLGSGDGRNIIAAARRGAQALGVEYNPDMVRLSQQRAKEAGVAEKAQFVEGDMYEADISKATVLALFLLPSNLDRLAPKFLALKPGTRIVLNTFAVSDWEADYTDSVGGSCLSWCNALMYIVPAQAGGTWRLAESTLTLSQQFQRVSGTFGSGDSAASVTNGRLLGDKISFNVGQTEYTGTVNGDRMQGVAIANGARQEWTATRQPN